MHDADCVDFLQRVLPPFGLRWKGYRKVRRQVCRRVARRMAALHIDRLETYERLLDVSDDERQWFEAACRITISRFFRDRDVFAALRNDILPALLDDHQTVRCWSVGCASGEEPYSLALIWHHALRPRFPGHALEILATDADEHMLARAREARYPFSAIRNVPAEWRGKSFRSLGEDEYELDPAYRGNVSLRLHDVRERLAGEEPFHLVLCRNLAFIYYQEPLRTAVLTKLLGLMVPGGFLVIGRRDALPVTDALTPVERCIFRYDPR